MATRSIAFRLNDKNREDKEIMDWLDKAVYEGEYYASMTEAVKWANVCCVRGEIRVREDIAIAFQHEIDHLNGILFIDKIDPKNPFKNREKMREI